MASYPNDLDEYEPSSDSGDERPNRWHGPPSTWQEMNSEEIDTLAALNELRNRDLSIHLYNAFALKQRHRQPPSNGLPVAGQDVNAATGQKVLGDDWVPQRSWTAWPMVAGMVPAPDFVPRADDADDKYTTRSPVAEFPSTALEEAVSAAVLRTAKEKFESRPWHVEASDGSSLELEVSGTESSDADESEAKSILSNNRSRSRSRSIKRESDAGSESAGEHMEVQGSDDRKWTNPLPLENHRLRPVVSTDDDMSYALLRPSVRHILSKLDATLSILHVAQESAMNYLSDSADSDASGSSRLSRTPSREGSQSAGKRKRGRPRKDGTPSKNGGSVPPGEASGDRGAATSREPSVLVASAQRSDPHGDGDKKNTRRGRPRKTYERLPDESDMDYAIRIARIQKKPIPTFSEPDSGDEAGRDSADEKAARKTQRPKRKVAEESSPEHPKSKRGLKGWWKGRAKLRDWKDVLGAAALAGFPPQAVDRAARRCADLFGQSMELHTLVEGPADQRGQVKTTKYVPGISLPPLLEPEDDHEPPPQARQVRAPSFAAGITSEGERGSSRGRSRSASNNSIRSRSRSASAGGSHFCHFHDCPRAREGFSRRPNLLRHLKLVHGFEGDALPVEVDSEDEIYGGVHVDGFLKPIKIRPGWRASDAAEEPRKRRRGLSRKSSASETDGGRVPDGTTGAVDVGVEQDGW
ncbi:hypothetical protein DL766_009915 [Monosporascus sp. MC13-8B]|nr:hypothetical protein DL766_009915 [Monosporascus sp. MC13-8B]